MSPVDGQSFSICLHFWSTILDANSGLIIACAEHEAREPTELGLRTEYFKSCKQVEEALLLDIMVKGSEPVDTLLAGQDFAELRRQATGIISNLPKYSRK